MYFMLRKFLLKYYEQSDSKFLMKRTFCELLFLWSFLWRNSIFLPQSCNGNNGILIQIQTETTTNHSYRILFYTLFLSNSATVQCAPLFYIAVLYQRHSLFFYFLSCLVGCLLHEDLSSKRHLDMHTNLPSRILPWSQYSALKVS